MKRTNCVYCDSTPMDDNILTKKCTKPWCKRTFPADSKYRNCEHCRHHDKENQKANRARRKDARASKDTQPTATGQKRRPEPGMELEEPSATRQRTNSDPNHCENGRVLTPSDDDDSNEFDQEPDENVTNLPFCLTKMITYSCIHSWQIITAMRKTFLTPYVQCLKKDNMWSFLEPIL